MITLRKSTNRGYADHGWLQSYHSFSFAGYYDPAFMGWGRLRVINEDFIAPGMGFGKHGHRDMEIVTVVLSGALAHADSLGNTETIPAGDIQRMSAGSGVMHSEFNPDGDRTTHLLQIWIEPSALGIRPGYEQKTVPAASKRGRLRAIASPDGRDDSVVIHADATIYAALLEAGESADLTLERTRKAYIHLIRGTLTVNGIPLAQGDALMIEDEDSIQLAHGESAEVLVFDLGA